MIAILLATVTLHWTNPTKLARLDDCSDSTAACHLTAANLYRQIGSDWVRLLRTHDYSAGVPATDTALVTDDMATYWVRAVNAAGVSYCETRGFTVGVPPVGIDPGTEQGPRVLYDVAGRRVARPARDGVYFEKTPKGMRLVVIRK